MARSTENPNCTKSWWSTFTCIFFRASWAIRSNPNIQIFHINCTDPLMNSREFWKWRIWLFQASLYNPEPSNADDNEWWKSDQGKRFLNPRKKSLDGGWRGGEEGHKRWEEGTLGQILLLHGKLSEYWVVYISIKRGPLWEIKWMFSSKLNHLQNMHIA